MDKDSCWTSSNGIKSIIPSVLTVSLLGYPFILPDMIGGNGYDLKPDKELFIRWIQLSALLPALQFSIPPWNYDSETQEIVRKTLHLREGFSPKILDLARNATVTGEPIIRPLWWNFEKEKNENEKNENEDTFLVQDQFLLGNEVMVAPVLDPGVKIRKVFIPDGIWRSIIDGFHHKGPSHIVQIVTLEDLPVFTLVG